MESKPKSKPRRRNLTTRFLDSLRKQDIPPYKGINYWDSYLARFGVRALGRADQDLNRISYQVMARVKKPGGGTKVNRKTIGQYPVLPLKEARERARGILQRVDDGENPFGKIRKVELPDTVAALFERYFKERIEPEFKDPRKSRWVYDRCIIPYLGDYTLPELTRADIKAALAEVETERGKSTRLLAHSALGTMLNWAVSEEIVDHSPMAGLKAPKGRKRTRILKKVEIPTVWTAADKYPLPFGAIVKFLLVTGQRRTTVGAMRWTDIEGETWTIPGELMKGNKDEPIPHAVPLSPLALQIIEAMPKGSSLVFATNLDKNSSHYDKPFAVWGRAKRLLDHAIKAEFPDMDAWVLHDLRRTQKTLMSEIGVDRTVSEMLQGRQAITGAESHYDRYDRWPERVAAMAAWDSYLQTLLGRPRENVVNLHG